MRAPDHSLIYLFIFIGNIIVTTVIYEHSLILQHPEVLTGYVKKV